MNNNVECAGYFKKHREYKRCLEQLLKKWKSYGKVTGYITLREVSEEERRAISGIIGKVFYEKDIKFSFSDFEIGLQKTKFAPIDIKEVLEIYFGEKLVTNQSEKQEKQNKKIELLENVCESLKEQDVLEIASCWIRAMVSEQKYGYQLFIREYCKSKLLAEQLVKDVGTALIQLEITKESSVPLAVFSAKLSGNPHYFDRNTTAGQLLIYAISYFKKSKPPQSAHEWRKLLLSVGIIPDNVSSMVHAYGLRLGTKAGWHMAYEAFCELKEPYVITMENLKDVISVRAIGDRVYIVENEMVFTYLLEHRKEVTLLCTSGQVRAAALELIPLILDSGADIYYSGDIDPEGIKIADGLWKKFGNQIQIWRMSSEDYQKGISEEQIGEVRMSKLRHLSNPELKRTAEVMQEIGKAAYQENILEELLGDMSCL